MKKPLKQVLLLGVSLLLLISWACTTEPIPASIATPQKTIKADSTSILIFQEEKKIEIWSKADAPRLIEILAIQNEPLPEFGYFHSIPKLSKSYNTLISKVKKHNPVELIVFPNDRRISGSFVPCFACPHQSAEIYAKLEMLLQKYQD